MARAVMYMAIRYEGGRDAHTDQSEPDLELTDNRSLIVKTSGSPAYMGLLSTLLAWHQADPPDDAERGRNEVVYSFQGNRRSEEHTSELQSLMRTSYAVFCLKKKKTQHQHK